MQRLAFTLIVAVLVGLPTGCRRSRPAPRPFGECSRDRPCPRPQTCVLRSDAVKGACVTPCRSDADCGEGFRCTGRYLAPDRPNEPARTYCQRAAVGPGGDCSRPTEACLPGLTCLHGETCTRICQSDGECSAEERCRPIRRRPAFGRPAETLYHACAPAPAAEGQACRADEAPFCRRGLVCLGRTCVTPCRETPDCGPGRICDGAADPEGEAPGGDTRFCRKAARLGEVCSPGRAPAEVGCEEPLRCYRGRCRQVCATDEDCGLLDGQPTRCRARKSAGQKVRVCLPRPGRRPR
jgi:hypothetical protein